MSEIRVENLPDYLYDIRVVFDSRQRNVASMSALSLFNEMKDPLEVTLLASIQRLNRTNLIIFSLFPRFVDSPEIQNYTIYSYGRPDHKYRPPADYQWIERMEDQDFQALLKHLKNEGFDDEKLDIASIAIQDRSLTVAQIQQILNVFNSDESRISFVELAFKECFDKVNYLSLLNDFTFQDAKDRLISFVSKERPEEEYVDRMRREELDDFLRLLKNENFDANRTKLVLAISNKASFTVIEIQEILSIYSFDEEKLKVAKLLFDNCSDKKNYYTLVDQFSFSSNKKDLQDFIRAHH